MRKNLFTAIVSIVAVISFGLANISAQTANTAQAEPQYQKMDSHLQEKLTAAAPDEKVKLWIWLIPSTTEEQTVDKVMSEHPEAKGKVIAGRVNPAAENQDEVMSMATAIQNEITEAHKKVYREVEDRVAQVLIARGFDIDGFSQYAPIIFATGNTDRIVELTKSSDVSAIYLRDVDIDKTRDQLDVAALTDKADVVWNRGITGSNLRIAVVEDNGIVVSTQDFLADVTYFDNGNPNVDRHATAVAGIIASQEPTFRGIAYGAPALLSANAQTYTEQNIINATEWALNNGALILNNSWGGDSGLQMTPLDRYLDHIVWRHYRTVVVAAGNLGSGNGNVTRPGLAYNVITVGGIDDRNTQNWGDDVMGDYSSFNDPVSPHNDREKPEVVAVGGSAAFPMTSTIEVAPWTGNMIGNDPMAGTSFAAPQVTGEAALLMQRLSWLYMWPESVKAIIMASAIHDIEGDRRLSDRDGAGAIDISNADDIAMNNQVKGESLYQNDFPKNYQFTVPNEGYTQRVRVVISWDSHPDDAHPPVDDLLQSDLDLFVSTSSGQYVDHSSSWDNNYEIVEFTTSGGTYSAEVSAFRFDGPYEYLGFAWSRSPL